MIEPHFRTHEISHGKLVRHHIEIPFEFLVLEHKSEEIFKNPIDFHVGFPRRQIEFLQIDACVGELHCGFVDVHRLAVVGCVFESG